MHLFTIRTPKAIPLAIARAVQTFALTSVFSFTTHAHAGNALPEAKALQAEDAGSDNTAEARR